MAQVQVQHHAPVSGPISVASGHGGAQFMPTSLYVGDLDVSVTDEQLYQTFGEVAPVVSVRVCRDTATGRSLGYGYVNYNNPRDVHVLDHDKLGESTLSFELLSLCKSGTANIFIKNLDKSIDHKALHDTFSSFGNILSCKISTDGLGQSKGYGFVQFDNEESAQNAIDKLNGMLINDKQVLETVPNKVKFNNVYVKNLSDTTTDEELKTVLGEHGEITSVVVMRDADGAVEALNGKKFEDKKWYVGKAQKKSEREHELKARFEQNMKEASDKFQDEKLKKMFSEFGNMTSCKVMRDPSGISKGSGFVAFSTPEEAFRALAEMNGKMIVSNPLYVAPAQRKEERRAQLQAQFSQMRPLAIPSVAPRMPVYPTGQAPPTVIPPQAGFGYQQQLVPGMRPVGPPLPNCFVPMVQQGQCPRGRRGTVPVQQAQQPVSLMQQPMLPRGEVYRYPPGHKMPEVAPSNVPGGMLSIPYDMGSMPVRDAGSGQPMPVTALATSLANAAPEQQRTMLGESLYPLVERLERDAAAKVTGMLLEMDQTEVLHLLESPEALKAKVAEAMEVLRSVDAQQQSNNPADQLSLTVTE
ncbi:hypothetical protein ES288_A02G099300v1 [Gossypium darwinii]|uniref:PABP n=1 Tax=Gossypium darwinii TaxID=34276 RepID=A0A5D2HD60_GOSDA|nr:hypothetical protein ES288_A02G099300v1 [Gossypium darwinii]